MKYTVILAVPDDAADGSAPVETRLFWAVAYDVPEAIVQAQHHVAKLYAHDAPEDFFPIGVFHGHLEELQ
jgi:hypothetical protein